MSVNHDNQDKRQAGHQGQPKKSDHDKAPGQQGKQSKSTKDFGGKRAPERQEAPGKGKIATSAPGGSGSASKRS